MKMSRMVCSVLLCLASVRMLPASDLSLDVDTGNPLHLVYDASSPVSAVISNVSSTVQVPSLISLTTPRMAGGTMIL